MSRSEIQRLGWLINFRCLLGLPLFIPAYELRPYRCNKSDGAAKTRLIRQESGRDVGVFICRQCKGIIFLPLYSDDNNIYYAPVFQYQINRSPVSIGIPPVKRLAHGERLLPCATEPMFHRVVRETVT